MGILRVEGDSLFGATQGQKGVSSVPCWLFCQIAVDYRRFLAKRGDQDQEQVLVFQFSSKSVQASQFSPKSVTSQFKQ